MFRNESTPTLVATITAVLGREDPSMGEVRSAQLRLQELARREGRDGCGRRSGYLAHLDRDEAPCWHCEAHDALRSEQRQRRWARSNAKRRSPRRAAQIASREEHARAFRLYRRDHPG